MVAANFEPKTGGNLNLIPNSVAKTSKSYYNDDYNDAYWLSKPVVKFMLLRIRPSNIIFLLCQVTTILLIRTTKESLDAVGGRQKSTSLLFLQSAKNCFYSICQELTTHTCIPYMEMFLVKNSPI